MTLHRHIANLMCFILLLLNSVACRVLPVQIPQPDRGAATPEEAARLTSPCDTTVDENANFVIHDKRVWGNGFIIIYSLSCPPGTLSGKPVQAVGHTFVELQKTKWYAHSSNWAGGSEPLDPKHFVEVGTSNGGGSDAKSNYSIVYGQVLTQDVSAIEVIFENGEIRRDQPKNHIFSIIVPGSSKACELRVFGVGGQLVHQRDLQPFEPKCGA